MSDPQTARPQPETVVIPADADEVCCDGGGGVLGHPRVWYNVAGRDSATCGYCGRVFVRGQAG